MTKQEQIKILSRISDTASMSISDRNELYSVIKEMKDEGEPQFVTAYNLDKLISGNGNWRLCYLYNRYGNNTLLLLPSFEMDASEEGEVKAIIDMNNSTFEECLVIEDYIRSCPNTPFVIREDGFINCIQTLTDRLSNLMTKDGETKMTEDGETKMTEEISKFLDFLKVCRMIQDGDEGFVYEVSEVGWQKFVPKNPKKFDSNYRLLEEMYEESYYPDHLVDVIKAMLTSAIYEIELGDTDIDRIRRTFQTFVISAISMLDNFANLNTRGIIMRKHDIYVITKDIEYILSWFSIDINIEDIMKRLL